MTNTAAHARACFLRACELDVAVRKPGNVSRASPGHGMRAELFIASAQATAEALFEPGARLWAVGDERNSVLYGTGHQLKLLVWRVPAVGVTRHVVPFDVGKHLAQECTTCHRIDGTDNGIPSIVGLDPEYFAGTIGFYQRGERTNQAMMSVAQSLDDEQVAALAAYYASLPKAGVSSIRGNWANSR